jgi:hypothetical protein
MHDNEYKIQFEFNFTVVAEGEASYHFITQLPLDFSELVYVTSFVVIRI